MTEGIATLRIDLGNSETRIMVSFGRKPTGEIRSKTLVFDNGFSVIDEEDLPAIYRNTIYDESNSSIFTVNGTMYCSGLLCEREYSTTRFRPTATDKKHSSICSKLTLHNAFRLGYETVADFTHNDISSLDISWNVVVLMPPEDIDSYAVDDETGEEITGWQKMSKMVKGITQINFEMPALSKRVKVNKVDIFPEGFCALIAVLFERKGIIRKDLAFLADKENTTLIVDIGAGTTDILLATGGSVVARSRFTVTIGGNNVHQIVRAILKKNNIILKDSVVRTGCERGYVKIGEKTYDLRKAIKKAKAQVSAMLMEATNTFFEQNGLSINSINNMLVCGGGACGNEDRGIEPISTYLVETLKTRSGNNIGLLKIPNGVDGKLMSPRMLNIIGAGILTEE